MLLVNYWYFKPGTIFVVVVDPEVGTSRKIVLVKTKNYVFFGPDNGILWPTIEAEGANKIIALDKAKVREITYSITKDDYFQRPVSDVFEGRDIYCPAVALFAKGVESELLGKEFGINELKKLNLGLKINKDRGVAKVVFIDDYGNLVIGCTKSEFERFVGVRRKYSILIGDKRISRISRNYTEGKEGELIALFGGDFEHPTKGAFLEIAACERSASEALGVKKGDKVTIITRR